MDCNIYIVLKQTNKDDFHTDVGSLTVSDTARAQYITCEVRLPAASSITPKTNPHCIVEHVRSTNLNNDRN